MKEDEIEELLARVREHGNPATILLAERRATELRRLYVVIEEKQRVIDGRKPQKQQPFSGACRPIGVR